MDYYNQYLVPHKNYDSVLSFVGCQNSLIFQEGFFVSFKNPAFKSGFYIDNDNYLRRTFELYKKYKLRGETVGNFHDIIEELNPYRRYFSIIHIDRDSQNPQLEGEFMIFKFGRAIYEKILKAGSPLNISLTPSYLKMTFHLKIKNTFGFQNYEESFFGPEEPENCDSQIGIKYFLGTINLASAINKPPVFNIKYFERSLKLKQINGNLS